MLTATTFEEGKTPKGFKRFPEPPWTSYTHLWVLVAHPDTSADGMKSLMNSLKANQPALAEAHSLYKFHKDLSFWLNGFIEPVPVQPEAAQFYKDNDIWNDKFSVGK